MFFWNACPKAWQHQYLFPRYFKRTGLIVKQVHNKKLGMMEPWKIWGCFTCLTLPSTVHRKGPLGPVQLAHRLFLKYNKDFPSLGFCYCHRQSHSWVQNMAQILRKVQTLLQSSLVHSPLPLLPRADGNGLLGLHHRLHPVLVFNSYITISFPHSGPSFIVRP